MDPISYLFSAYLHTVQAGVQQHLSESHNTQITPVEIEYEGEKVAFQHHLWRVRDQSVCSDRKNDLQAFSKCTLAAKKLFGVLCSELSKRPDQNPRHGKLRNMYCNASMSFKPTVARVGVASGSTELESARQACNAATVAAMGSREPRVIREKQTLCGVYEAIKAGQKPPHK